MGKTELTSFIGWVDLSEEDLRHAREYLRSLSEGTIDELGFGVIRDMFADLFFPATSTAMTRARYLIWVPSIYLCVQEQELHGRAARKHCDEFEQGLRDGLIANEELASRQRTVKTMPATNYWATLRKLGVYMLAGSQDQHFDTLGEYLRSQKPSTDDDKNAHVERESTLWDPEFVRLYNAENVAVPDPITGFKRKDLYYKLNRNEADYLKHKYLSIDQISIIHAALQQVDFTKESYPWDWKQPELKHELSHAKHFSMFAKLATLVYYEMICQLRREKKLSTATFKFSDVIDQWWELAREEILHWDLRSFMSYISERGSNREDDVFLTRLFDQIKTAPTATAFLQSKEVKRLIKEREKRRKKKRLIGGRFLDEWEPPKNGANFNNPLHIPYQFDFRSGIASTIVDEIFEGLQN